MILAVRYTGKVEEFCREGEIEGNRRKNNGGEIMTGIPEEEGGVKGQSLLKREGGASRRAPPQRGREILGQDGYKDEMLAPNADFQEFLPNGSFLLKQKWVSSSSRRKEDDRGRGGIRNF